MTWTNTVTWYNNYYVAHLAIILYTWFIMPCKIDTIISYQGSVRPDLDHRDLDWKCLSLNDETKVWVSRTRSRPRLKLSEFQWQDHDWDWKCLSLNDKTKTEKVGVSKQVSRLGGGGWGRWQCWHFWEWWRVWDSNADLILSQPNSTSISSDLYRASVWDISIWFFFKNILLKKAFACLFIWAMSKQKWFGSSSKSF